MNPQTTPDNYVNPLNSMQKGERQIFAIKRHPIGILFTYIVAGFGLLLLAIIIFGVAPALAPDHKDQIIRLGAGLFLIVLLMTLLLVLVSHYVYWGNRWVLTTDSLTQVSQTGLFRKESSQLSLANLEDVTAQNNGILARMFKFGVLRAETAGERSKFTFIYCPNPEQHAQEILNAREQFEQGLRAKEEAGERGAPAAPVASPPVPTMPPPTTPPQV